MGYYCKVAPETGLIIAALVVFTSVLWLTVKLILHFAAPPSIPVTAEWLDELSADVTDLLRLLDEEESQFLRTQPGFPPKPAPKLSSRRCRLLKRHLSRLENDFRLACLAIKVIIVQSERDRSDLAWLLIRNQVKFTSRMMMARFQLAWGRMSLV